MSDRKAQLTDGPVGRILLSMTGPMIVGMFALVAFNLADAFFVAQLGTPQLAAMSFTFPVVMFLGSIAIGLGIGTASVLSRAIGRGDTMRVRRIATDSLALAFLVVLVCSFFGMLTIDPLFRLLGAGPDLLPFIRDYMIIWYSGMAFLVVPMVGNNAIRATGDTRTPSVIMVIAALLNVALDPILIFGLFGMPRLEMAGAALATVITRALTLVLALAVLHFREGLLDLRRPHWKEVWASWREVLFIAIPAGSTNLLTPVSQAVITRIMAGFGPAVVAGFGAGTRVEAFAFLVIIALAISLTPFVGQNWGANRPDRVRRALWLGAGFAIVWGGISWVAFLATGKTIAVWFGDKPELRRTLVQYLWIIALTYGLQGVCHLASATLNAMNRPFLAAAVIIIRTFVFVVPLAYVGAQLLGVHGAFVGIAVGNVVAGIAALAIVWRTLGHPVPSDAPAATEECPSFPAP